ncbi:MAG: SRPBCC family protein [Rhodocyclaceae bacterium]|nr:SRPBCC family protein [Rhodocyclaceae bacterium]
MNDTPFHPPLNQIAFSVVDLRRTERWFREGLGFLPAGGSSLMMSGPLAAKVQGIPKAASTCWWLVGRNPWFQIEMFQFRRPMAKLMPADFRPCDIGYTRIGAHVADFDAALVNLTKLGSTPLTPSVGERGRRRACVRNPDGVYVEIMEDDPLPESVEGERDCAAAMRSVTVSTPDLDQSVAYLTAVTGHGPENIALHRQEHEALWGLPGAVCKRAVFCANDVLIEVVQYLDPIGKSWPAGYRICDQGILNIAFGARNKPQHQQVYERAMTFGARHNAKPVHLPGAGVVYVNDKLGFSVEILWMAPGISDRLWGFEPLPITKRPAPDNQRVAATVRIDAPIERVWKVLCDQNAMSSWIGFDEVRRTRDGTPDADGYGAERAMRGKLGAMTEQVTGVETAERIRYRIIEGSPFNFHNGEIALRRVGAQTEIDWTIRFRSKFPLLGWQLRSLLQRMLSRMLSEGLKPYAEKLR